MDYPTWHFNREKTVGYNIQYFIITDIVINYILNTYQK